MNRLGHAITPRSLVAVPTIGLGLVVTLLVARFGPAQLRWIENGEGFGNVWRCSISSDRRDPNPSGAGYVIRRPAIVLECNHRTLPLQQANSLSTPIGQRFIGGTL